MELSQRPAPQGVCSRRAEASGGTGRESQRAAREPDEPGEVTAGDPERHAGDAIVRNNERNRARVADQVLDEGLVGSKAPRHVAPGRRCGGDECGVPRRPLAHLDQQVGVRLLGTRQRLAGSGRRSGRGIRAAQPAAAWRPTLDVVRQLGDAVAEILLAGYELGGRIGQRVDAAAHEQLERLPRAQPLARLERRADPSPGILEQRQLRVDLPLVGEEGRASLRQGERAAGPLDFRQRGAELAGGRVHRPPGPEREPEPRVKAPRDLRRDALLD